MPLTFDALSSETSLANARVPAAELDEISARDEAAKYQSQRIFNRFEQHLKNKLMPDWE